jgi:ribonuclease HII
MEYPTFDAEDRLAAAGYTAVAGIDEAGRGAWAGPVVAAAVILPAEHALILRKLPGLRDSKQLSPLQRERLFEKIIEIAIGVGWGIRAPGVIDREGIIAATRQSAMSAIRRLPHAPDALLLDALRLPGIDLPQTTFPKADVRCFCVAAASVIAKVTRDRLMVLLDMQYPGYGFARHKGYGTAGHHLALKTLGPTCIHRFSFRPLRELQPAP